MSTTKPDRSVLAVPFANNPTIHILTFLDKGKNVALTPKIQALL